MQNRHALIDNKTGLVRNVIIWEGAEWLPPRDHSVIHDCDGQIGGVSASLRYEHSSYR
jgi:hypothetical protein